MNDTDNIKFDLLNLYKTWAGEQKDVKIEQLPELASNRKYFKISSESKVAIGAYNPDKRENRAFIYLTKQLNKHKLCVPELYAENLEKDIYILQYLGDTTLYSYLSENRKNNDFPEDIIDLYKAALAELPKFQITAGKTIDYSVCYPRSAFDRQSMMWDLNYFKYYFLAFSRYSI